MDQMKVLILGGSGMLGHKLWQVFSRRFDTQVTVRRPFSEQAVNDLFDQKSLRVGVLAEDLESVSRAFDDLRPTTVVNCIGIVKQDAAAKDPIASITVNALFPHRLAELCRARGARLIHLSTDCVFSGRAGKYDESAKPDAEDLYGRTKLLGEVDGENCLTIRTSMIGRELAGTQGLVEWFLSQREKRVRGFRRAIFSGFTTLALSELLANVVERHQKLSGLWHVAADPINKFDLLTLVRDAYSLNIDIEPDESLVCDRSLDGRRFRAATGLLPPSWPEMIRTMRQDETPYEQIRRSDA